MPQYLHSENQKLLWNAISGHPDFDNNSSKLNIRDWFGQILTQFDTRCSAINISTDELIKLNRETVRYMIQDLQQHQQQHGGAKAYRTMVP